MIPVDAPAVERGVGFFETVLLVGARASLWEAHVARLRGTLARFGLPAPTEDALADAARRAIAAAPSDEERALKITWLAAGAIDDASAWRLDASVRAIPPTTRSRRRGCHAITLPPELRRDTPEAKSTSYLACTLGLRAATRAGADEGLFVSDDGAYLEGTACAIAAWSEGRPAWPERGVLPSVTAAAFTSERRAIARRDLVRGAIVLGSLTKAAPLVSLDGEACEAPPSMLARIAAFNDELAREARAL